MTSMQAPPGNGETALSLGLLLVCLVAVVGLAKLLAPVIQSGVRCHYGAPAAVVGVAIAMLVLLPRRWRRHGGTCQPHADQPEPSR